MAKLAFEEWFNLRVSYKANFICHQCHVKKDNFAKGPNALHAEQRRCADDFIKKACHAGEKSGLSERLL